MMAVIEYEPELTSYDMCDHPDPTLADELGGLLSCLERIESALDIDHLYFQKPKPEHDTEAYAKLAVDYGDGITWALLDIEKYATWLPLGTEATTSLKSWRERAQAQWKLADVDAAEHLKRGEYRSAIWLVHRGCVRLRTRTLRIELGDLIEKAASSLPGAEKPSAGPKSVRKPPRKGANGDVPYIKPTTDNIMAVAVFDDVRKAGFTLEEWAADTGKSTSTIGESRIWKALRSRHKLPGGADFHSAEPAGPLMQDGRQVIRKTAHRSDYEHDARD